MHATKRRDGQRREQPAERGSHVTQPLKLGTIFPHERTLGAFIFKHHKVRLILFVKHVHLTRFVRCISQEWIDHKLVWNPQLYSGVDRLYVPAEEIWLPDIVLYNK